MQRGGTRRGALRAGLAVLAAVAVGCGGGGEDGGAQPTVRDGPSDRERALSALLTADEVPRNARVVGRAESAPEADSPAFWDTGASGREASPARFRPICTRGLDHAGAELHAVAQARSPTFHLPGESIVHLVGVLQDAEQAHMLLDAMRSPPMLACLGEEGSEQVRKLAAGDTGVRVGKGRAEVLDFPQVGDASLAVGVDVPAVVDGDRETVAVELLFVQEGRAVAMLASVIFAPRPGRDSAGLAQVIAERLVTAFE